MAPPQSSSCLSCSGFKAYRILWRRDGRLWRAVVNSLERNCSWSHRSVPGVLRQPQGVAAAIVGIAVRRVIGRVADAPDRLVFERIAVGDRRSPTGRFERLFRGRRPDSADTGFVQWSKAMWDCSGSHTRAVRPTRRPITFAHTCEHPANRGVPAARVHPRRPVPSRRNSPPCSLRLMERQPLWVSTGIERAGPGGRMVFVSQEGAQR
jgi:hypothetical protein